MAMPVSVRRYTIDQVRAFPDDGNRYELVDGVLIVTPSPATPHQIALARLMRRLSSYLEPIGLAYAVSPGEIEIEPDNHLEPDILVFPASYAPGTKWRHIRGWWLAAEALSPSSKIHDRESKHDAYLAMGVEEFWVLDHEHRVVEVSAQDGRRLVPNREVLRWHPPQMPEPLEVQLSEIFEGMPGPARYLRGR